MGNRGVHAYYSMAVANSFQGVAPYRAEQVAASAADGPCLIGLQADRLISRK